MNLSEVELPSNRKFGLFFSLIFFLGGGYFFFKGYVFPGYFLFAMTSALFLISIFKDDLLFPLNKLWMKFGFLLGKIISPIVLGLLFFALFTPYGLIMRLFGRDSLHLKINPHSSHWRLRDQGVPLTDFRQQY